VEILASPEEKKEMAKAKPLSPTHDSHPGRKEAVSSRVRTTGTGQLKRRRAERMTADAKKSLVSVKQQSVQIPENFVQPMLSHFLQGVGLAAASLLIHWLNPPNYIEGLVIILDVSWVLKQLRQ
jgi:hypothetical protein